VVAHRVLQFDSGRPLSDLAPDEVGPTVVRIANYMQVLAIRRPHSVFALERFLKSLVDAIPPDDHSAAS